MEHSDGTAASSTEPVRYASVLDAARATTRRYRIRSDRHGELEPLEEILQPGEAVIAVAEGYAVGVSGHAVVCVTTSRVLATLTGSQAESNVVMPLHEITSCALAKDFLGQLTLQSQLTLQIRSPNDGVAVSCSEDAGADIVASAVRALANMGKRSDLGGYTSARSAADERLTTSEQLKEALVLVPPMDEALRDGEIVVDIVHGSFQMLPALMLMTQWRLIMKSVASFNDPPRSIAFEEVDSILATNRFLSSKITIKACGSEIALKNVSPDRAEQFAAAVLAARNQQVHTKSDEHESPIESRLRRLDDLHARGLMSDEERATERQRMLSEL